MDGGKEKALWSAKLFPKPQHAFTGLGASLVQKGSILRGGSQAFNIATRGFGPVWNPFRVEASGLHG